MDFRRRASTNVGHPLVILALLGAVALPSGWDHLGPLARAGCVVALAALGVVGLALSAQPTGMGERWARRQDHEDDAAP